jgi:hypothetical protein
VNLGLFDDWESLRSLGGRVMGCWLKRFKGGRGCGWRWEGGAGYMREVVLV